MAKPRAIETANKPGDGRTVVLLTGFGPFPKVPVNATMHLVPRLTASARVLFPGVRFVSAILPTEWNTAPKRVDKLAQTFAPDLMLHFGVSGRARGFEIERRGVNACALAPDAAGFTPNDDVLSDDATDRAPSRLPVAEIVTRLRQRAIPAFESWNAGTYLCNATLFHSMTSKKLRGIEAGFVHIPSGLAPSGTTPLDGRRTRPGCPLTWEQAVTGGLEIVASCLGRSSPSNAAVKGALRTSRYRFSQS